MKSGVWVLDHDTGYKNIKKDLVGRYGKETVQQIWEKAGKYWEELCARYAHLPEKMKQQNALPCWPLVGHCAPCLQG